jgi:hypothetical protein
MFIYDTGLYSPVYVHIRHRPIQSCICSYTTQAYTVLYMFIYGTGLYSPVYVHIRHRPIQACICSYTTQAYTVLYMFIYDTGLYRPVLIPSRITFNVTRTQNRRMLQTKVINPLKRKHINFLYKDPVRTAQ